MIDKKAKNMNKRQRIFILGGSSYLGRRLFSRLGPRQATATYCKHPIKYGIYFDALKMNLLDIIEKPGIFSHAIILFGDTKIDFCAKNTVRSTLLNVTRIGAVIGQLKILGIIPVFISTAAVFDGTKGNYIETDPVNPLLRYGVQKVQVERYLQESCEKFIIVRLSKVFGSCPGDGTLFTEWLGQLENNESIKCAYDHIFSPIHLDEAVEGLVRLIQNDCQGLFHLCNKNAYCRLDMLKLLINCYRKYKQITAKVIECSLYDFPFIEKRPLNNSMNPDKIIESTALQIKSIDFWCRDITDKWIRN